MSKQKHALVVDDSKAARLVLQRMLEKHDLAVDTVESAGQALDFLIHRRPDVIFMDHMMPDMDGFEAIEAIKGNPATATIPIMMYTSKSGELYVSQARALGAIGILPKQVQPAELFRVLENLGLVLLPLGALTILLELNFHATRMVTVDAGPGLKIHILISILAYSVLTLASVQAVLVAVQDQHLRNRHPGGFIRALPPLQTMEVLLFEMIGLGFASGLPNPLTGTTLIKASAGTGKTYTLGGLFVRLILEQELEVEQILVVTYTTAATEELKTRIRSKLIQTRQALLRGDSRDPFIHRLIADGPQDWCDIDIIYGDGESFAVDEIAGTRIRHGNRHRWRCSTLAFGRRPAERTGIRIDAHAGGDRGRIETEGQGVSGQIAVSCGCREAQRGQLINRLVANSAQHRCGVHIIDSDGKGLAVDQVAGTAIGYGHGD